MKTAVRHQQPQPSIISQLGIIALLTLIYAAVFLLLYPSIGNALGALSIIPIAYASWHLGLRRGLLFALILFTINESLYEISSDTFRTWSLQSIPGLIFVLIGSGTVGGLSDLLTRVRAQSIQIEVQRKRLEEEIVQRKQAEQALIIARDAAISADSAKTMLLRKVSHEWRTPLSVISGYAEMLQENVYGTLNIDQSRIAGEIKNSGDFLTDLINNMLEQAKLEINAVRLMEQSIDIRPFAKQIENQLCLLAVSKGLTFEIFIDEQLPQFIVGDKQRLQQILTNLVNNSIKFTQEGGVTVRFLLGSNEDWQIIVADSGCGIEAAQQDKIFEPFFQIEHQFVGVQKGTGLGLSIVKQLVDQMNGTISLQSKIDVGTSFTVTLPLTHA